MSNATSTVRRRLPGRPRAKTSVGAREALLSAVELFAQQGVAATRFAMIAERAALTPAMLHYYFEDRERLLDAVVQERMAPAITTVWAPVTAGRPATVLIRGVVERLLDGVERTPWIPSTWIRDVAPAMDSADAPHVARCRPNSCQRVHCGVCGFARVWQ
jgi:TetR/AcrR family transcriptional regulator